MRCTKAVLRRQFKAINSCVKKQDRSQINKILLHIRELEKKQSPKWVEERKLQKEWNNKIETKNLTEKINKIELF